MAEGLSPAENGPAPAATALSGPSPDEGSSGDWTGGEPISDGRARMGDASEAAAAPAPRPGVYGVEVPPAGRRLVYPIHPQLFIRLDFDLALPRVGRRGDDMVLCFDNGGEVVFRGFVGIAETHPTLHLLPPDGSLLPGDYVADALGELGEAPALPSDDGLAARPAQSEPAQSAPVQPEPAQPEPVQPEPVQADPTEPDPAQAGPTEPEAVAHAPVQTAPVPPEAPAAAPAEPRQAAAQREPAWPEPPAPAPTQPRPAPFGASPEPDFPVEAILQDLEAQGVVPAAAAPEPSGSAADLVNQVAEALPDFPVEAPPPEPPAMARPEPETPETGSSLTEMPGAGPLVAETPGAPDAAIARAPSPAGDWTLAVETPVAPVVPRVPARAELAETHLGEMPTGLDGRSMEPAPAPPAQEALQAAAWEEEAAAAATEVPAPQNFESQSFESQDFEPQSFEPQSFESQDFEPRSFQPEVAPAEPSAAEAAQGQALAPQDGAVASSEAGPTLPETLPPPAHLPQAQAFEPEPAALVPAPPPPPPMAPERVGTEAEHGRDPVEPQAEIGRMDALPIPEPTDRPEATVLPAAESMSGPMSGPTLPPAAPSHDAETVNPEAGEAVIGDAVIGDPVIGADIQAEVASRVDLAVEPEPGFDPAPPASVLGAPEASLWPRPAAADQLGPLEPMAELPWPEEARPAAAEAAGIEGGIEGGIEAGIEAGDATPAGLAEPTGRDAAPSAFGTSPSDAPLPAESDEAGPGPAQPTASEPTTFEPTTSEPETSPPETGPPEIGPPEIGPPEIAPPSFAALATQAGLELQATPEAEEVPPMELFESPEPLPPPPAPDAGLSDAAVPADADPQPAAPEPDTLPAPLPALDAEAAAEDAPAPGGGILRSAVASVLRAGNRILPSLGPEAEAEAEAAAGSAGETAVPARSVLDEEEVLELTQPAEMPLPAPSPIPPESAGAPPPPLEEGKTPAEDLDEIELFSDPLSYGGPGGGSTATESPAAVQDAVRIALHGLGEAESSDLDPGRAADSAAGDPAAPPAGAPRSLPGAPEQGELPET